MYKKKILTNLEDGVYHIILNRSEKGNCYDSLMILEIIHAFQEVRHLPSAKVIFLKAHGPHFCTGADLDWMKKAFNLSSEENYRDMEKIKIMYQEILQAELPIVGLVHGTVSGGGVGLALICDILIAEKNTEFSLPESSVGLIPGIITPIIVNKIGKKAFLEMSLTGKKINSSKARQMNMINFEGSTLEVEKYLEEVLEQIKSKSLAAIKKIIETTRPLNEDLSDEMEKYLNYSSEMRQSPDFYEFIKKHSR